MEPVVKAYMKENSSELVVKAYMKENSSMDIRSAFNRVFFIILILIGVLVCIFMNTDRIVSSGLSLTSYCIGGDSEIVSMWYSACLTFWFIINAFFFAIYGIIHLGKTRGLAVDALPTRFEYLLIGSAYTFTMFAVVTTFATVFFMSEVRYMKFRCQSRAFQYTLPSIAVNVIVGCGMIIYQAWRTPHT